MLSGTDSSWPLSLQALPGPPHTQRCSQAERSPDSLPQIPAFCRNPPSPAATPSALNTLHPTIHGLISLLIFFRALITKHKPWSSCFPASFLPQASGVCLPYSVLNTVLGLTLKRLVECVPLAYETLLMWLGLGQSRAWNNSSSQQAWCYHRRQGSSGGWRWLW